jgi:hypothetical protein
MSNGFNQVDAELTLQLEEQAVGSLANTLDVDTPGAFALDAYQGKVLDGKKLDKDRVANHLTTTEEGWALDARMGKYLGDNKVGFIDIADNLTTDDPTKVLSAKQGKALQDNKINYSDISNNLSSDATQRPLSAAQGKALKGLVDAKATYYKVEKNLIKDNWTGSEPPFTYTLTLDEVKETDLLMLFPGVYPYDTPVQAVSRREEFYFITRFEYVNKHVTFKCYEEKPSMLVPIVLVGFRKEA